MYKVIMDYASVSAVFMQYSVAQAIQVKRNIEFVLSQLNLPSQELLLEMKREGISLSELSTKQQELDTSEISRSVAKRHLTQLFLDHAALYQALIVLDVSQKVVVNDYLINLMSLLKLPSASLLLKMEEQGVISSHPLNIVAQDNREPTNTQSIVVVSQVKQKLSKFNNDKSHQDYDEVTVARVKAKLKLELKHQHISDVERALKL